MKKLLFSLILLSGCANHFKQPNYLFIQGGYAQEAIGEINTIEFNHSNISSCFISYNDIKPKVVFKSPDLTLKDGVIIKGSVKEEWLASKCNKSIKYLISIDGDPNGMVDSYVEKIY